MVLHPWRDFVIALVGVQVLQPYCMIDLIDAYKSHIQEKLVTGDQIWYWKPTFYHLEVSQHRHTIFNE